MKQSPTWFDVYLINVKSSGRLFQIFVAFSEYLNFIYEPYIMRTVIHKIIRKLNHFFRALKVNITFSFKIKGNQKLLHIFQLHRHIGNIMPSLMQQSDLFPVFLRISRQQCSTYMFLKFSLINDVLNVKSDLGGWWPIPKL